PNGAKNGAENAAPKGAATGRPTGAPSGSPSASHAPAAAQTAKPVNPVASVPGSLPSAPHQTRRPAAPFSGFVRTFTGLAFDTCTAPSASKMASWKSGSPYGAAAVYIGGANRGCAQPQLTSSWVTTVSGSGWKLIPIYVGAQPPCQTGGSPERLTAATAATLGARDGADAVTKAAALGMRPASALYLDMEPYAVSDTSCNNAVLTYVQAWNRALHTGGYLAGFYGFSSSSAAAVAAAKATMDDMPDAFWYAKYDGVNSTTIGFPFAANLWTGHRRGHQFLVNSKETYGGVTLTVDRDAWDGPVAVV
ncbi:glycoside hydrolase domain-containing protein, partial [Streptomyces sp. CBMA29]|uniref:glycoside hydrolase domain-containing protein n=1 Tax=Streptomyces sp. CBMA29 TaxID=1896314 RepID=UPI002948BDB0